MESSCDYDPDVLFFLQTAGFGILEDAKTSAVQPALQADYVKQYSVKKRYSAHVYLFGDEVLDDLGGDDCNGTSASTSSAISKFDTWFCSLSPVDVQLSSKQTLQLVYEQMLAFDNSLPPFLRVCILNENDQGVVLAHFLSGAIKKNGK